MFTLAILNQKGGSGKTTTAVNLAAAFARSGRDTVVLDLDPQAHATLHLGVDPRGLPGTCHNVLSQRTPISELLVRVSDNLRILPSHIALSASEGDLARDYAGALVLRQAIQVFRTVEAKPLLVIDAPPTLGMLAINSLVAATHILVPVAAEFLALEGMSQLLRTLEELKARLDHDPKVLGLLMTRYDGRKKLCVEVHDRMTRLERPVFETIIRENVRLSEAPSHGQSIFDYDAASYGSADYQALFEEITRNGF